MLGLKPSEMLMILAIILLLFGGSRIADLGGSLGQGIRNFKKGLHGEDEPAKPNGTLQSATSVDAQTNAKAKQG